MEIRTSTLKANFNYHTGQCLSEVPSTKSLSKIRRKHKGKLKKRSILEIYAEASPCTLEDLPSHSSDVPKLMPNVSDQAATEDKILIPEINGSNGSFMPIDIIILRV
ncbi:hypothetical protein AQUCO_12600005v1 [Aquilegia coerulea]|uniref:Uncharacterized protein n=1 Tax=Aquilegia coerulea TaxID=218851 RepID=A0A2G5C2P6_AQUCA|nr:hypothetical protein AQUCO_12600005v1 [Aquilegia coerulea]